MQRTSFLVNLQACRLIANTKRWTPSQVFFNSVLSPPPPCSPMYWVKPPLSNPPCSQHLWENLAKIPLSVHCNNQECLTSTRKAKVTKCYFCIKTWLFTHFVYIILISDLAWHASIHYDENSKPKYMRFWVLLRKIYFHVF